MPGTVPDDSQILSHLTSSEAPWARSAVPFWDIHGIQAPHEARTHSHLLGGRKHGQMSGSDMQRAGIWGLSEPELQEATCSFLHHPPPTFTSVG